MKLEMNKKRPTLPKISIEWVTTKPEIPVLVILIALSIEIPMFLKANRQNRLLSDF